MFMADEIDLWGDDPDDIEQARYEAEEARGEVDLKVDRIALNMPQIRQYNPPPNPAKVTDSRATKYIDRFGSSSWELDALNPATLEALIIESIDKHLDVDLFNERVRQQREERAALIGLVKGLQGGAQS